MIRSKPKAYAIVVVVLEIIFCILLYLCCIYIRRRRYGHKIKDLFRRSEGNVVGVTGSRLVTDSSVLIFIPYSVLKDFEEIKTRRLRCATCLREMNDNDETLRLMPKCGHVFHPCCLIDPCSTLCPCRKAIIELTREIEPETVASAAIGVEIEDKTKGVIINEVEAGAEVETEVKTKSILVNEVKAEAEVIDEIEVETEIKAAKSSLVNEVGVTATEVVLDIELIDEKSMTKLSEEVIEKIIVYAKVISSNGKVYSKARYIW
ncbi:hypothetical protein RND81_04G203600 [Saponaria officinalis]|uniref:RING-type E3 ubiquitin transferase n=1 Tax=Saponaria officinalis TaxID=3572 RepID=A0AAW1LJV4_SAPOF